VLLLILCFSIAATAISLVVAIRIFLPKNGKAITDQINSAVASGMSSMNLRLDSLQQSFSNGLTTNLEASSRGIVAAIAQVKDETRARIDERLDVLTRESRGAFDTFREGMEKQVSGARVETQDSFKKFSDTLDLRSGSLQTQVSSGIGRDHRIPLAELACMSPKRRQELADRLGGKPGRAPRIESAHVRRPLFRPGP